MRRSCARPTCTGSATATFAYDYKSATVWLDVLTVAPDPATHDLCDRHAARLTVPRGWTLVTRSTVTPLSLLDSDPDPDPGPPPGADQLAS